MSGLFSLFFSFFTFSFSLLHLFVTLPAVITIYLLPCFVHFFFAPFFFSFFFNPPPIVRALSSVTISRRLFLWKYIYHLAPTIPPVFSESRSGMPACQIGQQTRIHLVSITIQKSSKNNNDNNNDPFFTTTPLHDLTPHFIYDRNDTLLAGTGYFFFFCFFASTKTKKNTRKQSFLSFFLTQRLGYLSISLGP